MVSQLTEFPDTQPSLIEHIKSLSDREAWEQFVSLYRPVIYRMARRRGFQEADAQDLTQKVFASIANSIHRWKKQNESIRFRHWLRRVVKHAIINTMTRSQNQIAKGGPASLNVCEPTTDPGSELEIELEYQRELFKQAASIVQHEVEPTTWLAFQLTVIEDKNIEQSAAELGKSIGSIYAARSRVMRRLKDAVQALKNQLEEF